MKSFCLSLAFVLLAPLSLLAQPSWTFDKPEDLKPWRFGGIGSTESRDGVLSAVITGDDPQMIAEGINFPAKRWQAVDLRLKVDANGGGEIYFTGDTEGPYGGFTGKKVARFDLIGDSQWHEYRVYPFWEKEKQIIKFRLDFPHPPKDDLGKRKIEVDWIRVVDLGTPASVDKADWNFKSENMPFDAAEGATVQKTSAGWETTLSADGDGFLLSRPFSIPVDDAGYWIGIAFGNAEEGKGTLRYATDSGKFQDVQFDVDGNGVCNIDMGNQKGWSGNLQMIGLKPGDKPNAKATIRAIRVSPEPLGPARIKIDREGSGLTNAINRVGQKLLFEVLLDNLGGKTAEVSLKFELPSGLKLDPASKVTNIAAVPGGRTRVACTLLADQPVDGAVGIDVVDTASGKSYVKNTLPVKIGASLGLPKASYVPEPKPVKSDYEISALYYGGWGERREWDRIEKSQPIRKPVLGWYDEANPECIDWQIKWAAENGIRNFFVCWYWNRGAQHKNHWVANFPKAKYKSYLKWCVMWANHHGGGSHSEEDQTRVTEYWIEHFFKTPEYHTIDGKPVVMLWSPKEMDDDIRKIYAAKERELKKGEGVKKLLDLSRDIAVKAGFKGIYFMCMKSPEGSTDREDIQWLADAGFDSTTIYHYMESGGKAKNWQYFDFQLVADSSLSFWEAWRKASSIPFQPNISSGWDDRPWNNHKTIYGRTPALFRKILDDYKTFAAESGLKRVMLSPLNEWGEGSYLEPNREFGFGMYEELREALCQKPAEGWPVNYGPSDVGLGPYDLPETVVDSRTSWDFSTGPQGWNPRAHIDQFKAGDGRMTFKTTGTDPVLTVDLARIPAAEFDRLTVRMKVSSGGNDSAQIFWTTPSVGTMEQASVRTPLQKDGQFHDYTFDLASNKRWNGRITGLRFDPSNLAEVACEIERISLEGPATKAVATSNEAPTDGPRLELIGDWNVKLGDGPGSATFEISRPEPVKISDEKLSVLPLYNEKGPVYNRGVCLSGVKAQECSTCGALDLASVVVRDKPGQEGKAFQNGVDYKVDSWGRIGRLEGGAIAEKQPVFVSYDYAEMRIDSIVLSASGSKAELRRGESHVSIPAPPELNPGEKRLANIWISGAIPRLTEDLLFPVLADRYPEQKRSGPSVAEKLLPKTLKKLRDGEKVHILAWGDSVTDANYLPNKDERWQVQFVERLRQAFPKAEIVLTTEAWGGKNSDSFMKEPPGSLHNYKEKVLDAKPDLVAMEFINDSWFSEQVLFERYGKILDDFNAIGAEWIILTPHYMRADMMGLKSNKDIDEDPRPYVRAIRKFGPEKGVAVAEGSKRYGHLWRQGIPYQVLLMNSINHPNGFGMSQFADALMELFP